MPHMGALLDLWKSERGLIAVALIAAATTLCGLGIIDVTAWLDYTKWIFVTYAAAKTVTGAVGMATAPAKPADLPAVWQQLEPLVTSVLTRFAKPAVPPPTAAPIEPTPAPVSIVPPPKAS